MNRDDCTNTQMLQVYVINTFQQTKIYFQVHVNEKYGIYGCPSKIPAKDLDPLLHKVGKEDKKQILSVYWLDEGHVPPVYVFKCPEVPEEADVPDEEIADPDAEKEKEERLEEATIQTITNLLWLNSTSDFQKAHLKSGNHFCLCSYH